MTLYKVTDAEGRSIHGGTGKWTLGRWRSVTGALVPCERGLHLCREADLIGWLGPVIWEAETEGEVIEAPDKVVARKARIVRRVETWNDRTARLFAVDCAEHVLPLFEKRYPKDARPRQAIEVARRFARGEATDKELYAARAARDAARAAATDAAWAAATDARDAARAAWDAARAAATDAAWAAATDARAAAWDAARAAATDARAAATDAAWAAATDARDAARAAWDAARAARDAAWAAATDARAAATDAAWAAATDARDAARAAERTWQRARLMDYLEGRAS